MSDTIGQRILVWGNSCAGKSTMAASLAEHFQYPWVELDALNWLPNWEGLNATDPDRLLNRMTEATQGDEWVVSGSYTAQSKVAFWPRVDTVIWIDLPRWLLLIRCLKRSWQRSRKQTLLWGTNRESFVTQLMVWRGEESLVWWVFTQHERKRIQTLDYIADGTWDDAHVIRLTSTQAVKAFLLDNNLPLVPASYSDGDIRTGT
ncbi:MAG: adenylate kinase family enzyme [Limisphaerales bacterium]|jgi:adenylate kinase family enzyme